MQETRVQFLSRKDPLQGNRRKWQPTPVFLPGESYGQRSLLSYSPQGHEELDRTEHTHVHTQAPLTFSQVHLVKTDSLVRGAAQKS